MDDSSLDLYEDLFVDAIYKVPTQTLPFNYAKPEPEEESDSKIDLFMEALAVHTIDKVQSQLLELQVENQKLRSENLELKESKKQLSKNISSLFLTARQEIQKKEQEITKLMLERLQVNCESCRLKPVQRDFNHPLDTISSSVNSRPTAPKSSKTEKPPQSEIRNKLMQEINQSYSLASGQGVASRRKHKVEVFDIPNVHKHGNNALLSEPEALKAMADEIKSYEDRKVAGSKPDTSIRNNHSTKYFSSTSDHQQPYVSTFGLTAGKESQSISLNNKRAISDVETQRLLKIRKIETPKINLMKNSTERTEKINSTKLVEERCSNQHEHLAHYDSKTASFDLNSTLNNSEPTISGHTSRKLKHFMFVGTSDNDMSVCDVSNRLKLSHFQGTFVLEESSGNHLAKSTQDSSQHTSENGSMQCHIPQIHQSGTSLGFVSSADTFCSETFDGKGSPSNLFQTDKLNCHLKSDCSLTSVKTLLDEASRECTRQSHSFLNDRSFRADNQTSLNGNDTASCTKLTSSTQWKKIMPEGHDQNSNCSISESPYSQIGPGDENCQNDSRDELLFSVDDAEPTYITCTSNLILLGDEETTCTTITSPYKLQPSEFYPPGVRGYVHEGGSHARHIRGITEVIKKVPIDKCHKFQSKPKYVPLACRTTDENIQVKTWDGTSDENNSKNSSISDNLNCQKTPKSGIIHNVEIKESLFDKTKEITIDSYLKVELNSQVCNSLEVSNGNANFTNASHKDCDVQDKWTSAVNDMFGTVFHKKLCALKQGPFLKNPKITQGKTDSVTTKIVSGISETLKINVSKERKQKN